MNGLQKYFRTDCTDIITALVWTVLWLVVDPGGVIVDLAGISVMAIIATIYPPAALGQALGRTGVTGAAAAQSVNHASRC